MCACVVAVMVNSWCVLVTLGSTGAYWYIVWCIRYGTVRQANSFFVSMPFHVRGWDACCSCWRKQYWLFPTIGMYVCVVSCGAIPIVSVVGGRTLHGSVCLSPTMSSCRLLYLLRCTLSLSHHQQQRSSGGECTWRHPTRKRPTAMVRVRVGVGVAIATIDRTPVTEAGAGAGIVLLPWTRTTRRATSTHRVSQPASQPWMLILVLVYQKYGRFLCLSVCLSTTTDDTRASFMCCCAVL